jgi:hypothetical protein
MTNNYFGGGRVVKTTLLNLLYALCIGAIFFICRQINLQALEFSVHHDLAHIVYFPAGIRLLAVLLFGWLGIFGILIGWIFCYFFAHEKSLLECIFLGLISGLTAYVSLLAWQFIYQINHSLNEMTAMQLLNLVFISSGISAFIRFFYIYAQDQSISFITIFSVGLMGDILGTLILLYLIKLVLYGFKNISVRKYF